MKNTWKLFISFCKLLLPIGALLFLVALGAAIWLIHTLSDPPKSVPLVNLKKLAQLSSRGARVMNKTWTNKDGTSARGLLLKGSPGSPAVILLHRYGTDRSHVLNLGVKLNESTDFTVLMPDLRGHGLNPSVQWTSFGGCEVEDVLSSINFLRTLKTEEKENLVSDSIGIYGIELGAFTGLLVAAKDRNVKALVLESVPNSSDHLIISVAEEKFPFGIAVTGKLLQWGTYPYYLTSCYERAESCELAKSMSNRNVMLLAGTNAPAYQTSTSSLASCFPENNRKKVFTSITPSGFDLTNSSLEQIDAYDQRVVFFLKQSLEIRKDTDKESLKSEKNKGKGGK